MSTSDSSSKINVSKPTGRQLSTRNRITPSHTPPSSCIKGKQPSPRTKTSTPSTSIVSTPNRSCNLSPITNTSDVSKAISEKCEPKFLKSLVPQFSKERKSTAKSSDGINLSKPGGTQDLCALYMFYQQQVYINKLLKQNQDKVLDDGQKQLEKLYNLVKDIQLEISEVESRTQLLENHNSLIKTAECIEPILIEAKELIDGFYPDYESLASALDGVRHRIPLKNINPVDSQSLSQIVDLMENGIKFSEGLVTNQYSDITECASVVSHVVERTSEQLKTLESCHELSEMTIARLGQELSLQIDEHNYKTLSDLNV